MPAIAQEIRKDKFIQGLAVGKSASESARDAGYSEKYARKYASKTSKDPKVTQAVAAIRAQSKIAAAFTLDQAMERARYAIKFAIKHKHPMALCKATEHEAKLAGLLIDRVETVTLDLSEALEHARNQVGWGPLPVVVNTGSEQPQLASPQESTDRMSEVYSEPPTDGKSGDSASVSESESQSQAG